MSSANASSLPRDRRVFGPRAQTVHDLNHRTPSLASFLNVHVEPVFYYSLAREQRTCHYCSRPMCPELHEPPPMPPVPRTPPPLPPRKDSNLPENKPPTGPLAPTKPVLLSNFPKSWTPLNLPNPPNELQTSQLPNPPNLPHPSRPLDPLIPSKAPRLPPRKLAYLPNRGPTPRRQPNGPGQLPADFPPDVCPNRRMCEIVVQITVPGCGHQFGHGCVARMIALGMTRCPDCNTIWFKDTQYMVRLSIFREAWPWRAVKLPVAGGKGKRSLM